MPRISPFHTDDKFIESTPEQDARATAETEAVVSACRAICMKLDVGLAALPAVMSVYQHRLHAIVFGDHDKVEQERQSLIATILDKPATARMTPSIGATTPIRGRRRLGNPVAPGLDRIDAEFARELAVYNMSLEELRAEDKRLRLETEQEFTP